MQNVIKVLKNDSNSAQLMALGTRSCPDSFSRNEKREKMLFQSSSACNDSRWISMDLDGFEIESLSIIPTSICYVNWLLSRTKDERETIFSGFSRGLRVHRWTSTVFEICSRQRDTAAENCHAQERRANEPTNQRTNQRTNEPTNERTNTFIRCNGRICNYREVILYA
ncbi:uncharacterized protein LOC143147571 [Ptiloglossa arizonensis]|uniref:uncharacterized protein LOC143147571 n=1 Tax=Ptiloglossa arizonensis TaxID=3350558 RepID=UPI003FA0408A